MQCPQCQADVSDGADRCFHCGHTLRSSTTLVRGSLIGGRYQVLALLGKGGMGMVYKAHDNKLEETVAIKVLRPDLDAGQDLERRFRTEIRLARKVRHRIGIGLGPGPCRGEQRHQGGRAQAQREQRQQRGSRRRCRGKALSDSRHDPSA